MSQKLAIAETQKLIQLVSQTKWNYQLSQFEDKATREVLKSTKRARAEITKTLAGAGKGASLKRWEKQRLTALGEELQHLSVAAQAQITGTIANAAEVAGKASYVAQNKILSFGGMIPNFHPVALSAAQLHSMVTKTPVGGKLLNKWVGDTFDYNIQKNIKSELLTGMLKGESYKDMTKRFSGKVFNGLDNDMEALTRTYVQSSNVNAAFDVAKANADIVKGWKWNSVAENRTCIRCMSLDSQDEVYSIGKGPEMPLHPRCFVSQKVPIYTSKGWKPIGEVKIGDFVLTHKHRFRKVYALPRSRQFAPDTVRIEFKKFEGVSLTANHMVQVGDPDTGKTTWKEAGDCKKGDHIMLLANRCHRCGKLIPYTQKYCGHRCVSLDITDRQWSDPEHRKNISVKNSISMNNQYTSGERDRFEITKQANKVNIEMIENGAHAFQQEDIHVLSNAANNTPDHKKRSSLRMKKKNPMHDPAVVKLVQDKLAVWRDKYPGKHPNVIMAKKGFMSGIERKMKQILDKSGVQYQAQFPVKRKGRGYYFVDFAISSLKIAIEVDGAYWHENTEKDMIRQREIEKAGWTVIRFSEERINNCLNEVTDEVTRMVCNHSELYETVPWLVTGVIKKKLIGTRNLYNLSVEEDESYIARGMVVHNCRCFPEFVTKTFREMGVDVDEIEKAYRPYTVRGTVDPLTGKIIPGKIGVGGGKIIETGRFLGTYEDFLKTQPVNVQKQILGPSRLELWKSGKVALKDFADAKGNQYLLTELRGVKAAEKGFVPAKTIRDAEKLALQAQGVAVSGIDDLKVLNEYMEALHESGVKNISTIKGWDGLGGKCFADKVDAAGNILTWGIHLPSKGMTHIAKITDMVDHCPNALEKYYTKDLNYNWDELRYKFKRGTSVQSTKDIATHEIGHVKTAFTDKELPKGIKHWGAVEDEFQKWVDAPGTRGIFSTYGASHYGEALAEAYVEYSKGAYKKGMLPAFLEDIFLQKVKRGGK